MLKHQISLIPTTPDDVISPTSEHSRGFSWWAVPSPRGWLLVNENFGYIALVPDGEEKLVNRVGRTAIETISRLAPGDKKHLAASISDHFEDIRWLTGEDMPDYLEQRIVRVMKLAEKSKDQFSFEKAVERMNTSASRIVGSEFADDIYGGNVNDTIIAGAGDDIIRGGAGADTIDTGTGTNTIIVGGTGAIAAGESYTGGGTDTLFVTGTTDFGGVTVIDSIETILLAAGVSATFEAAALTGDTIAVNGTGDNGQESLIVRGTASNDTINLGGLTLDTNDISGVTINGLGGDDTIIGTNGGDTITGGVNADTITGKSGADAIYLGVDTAADTVRADEGDGQMLIAGEIAHLDSDRIEQFNATHDKFVVSGAGTSVILNGAAAAQTAGTTFQDVATGTFDLNGTVGGAYIIGAGVGNLRDFTHVQTEIGALANESVGEEAYFVLRDGGGLGNAGVYHFRSVTANGEVDVGEIELLGLILTSGDLSTLAAGNFVFA